MDAIIMYYCFTFLSASIGSKGFTKGMMERGKVSNIRVGSIGRNAGEIEVFSSDD